MYTLIEPNDLVDDLLVSAFFPYPNKHKTLERRRLDVITKSRRHKNVQMTLF